MKYNIRGRRSFLKVCDLKEFIVDKVIIYRKRKGAEFENLYSGFMYNTPSEILNLSVHLIGTKKEDVLDIMVQNELLN